MQRNKDVRLTGDAEFVRLKKKDPERRIPVSKSHGFRVGLRIHLEATVQDYPEAQKRFDDEGRQYKQALTRLLSRLLEDGKSEFASTVLRALLDPVSSATHQQLGTEPATVALNSLRHGGYGRLVKGVEYHRDLLLRAERYRDRQKDVRLHAQQSPKGTHAIFLELTSQAIADITITSRRKDEPNDPVERRIVRIMELYKRAIGKAEDPLEAVDPWFILVVQVALSIVYGKQNYELALQRTLAETNFLTTVTKNSDAEKSLALLLSQIPSTMPMRLFLHFVFPNKAEHTKKEWEPDTQTERGVDDSSLPLPWLPVPSAADPFADMAMRRLGRLLKGDRDDLMFPSVRSMQRFAMNAGGYVPGWLEKLTASGSREANELFTRYHMLLTNCLYDLEARTAKSQRAEWSTDEQEQVCVLTSVTIITCVYLAYVLREKRPTTARFTSQAYDAQVFEKMAASGMNLLLRMRTPAIGSVDASPAAVTIKSLMLTTFGTEPQGGSDNLRLVQLHVIREMMKALQGRQAATTAAPNLDLVRNMIDGLTDKKPQVVQAGIGHSQVSGHTKLQGALVVADQLPSLIDKLIADHGISGPFAQEIPPMGSFGAVMRAYVDSAGTPTQEVRRLIGVLMTAHSGMGRVASSRVDMGAMLDNAIQQYWEDESASQVSPDSDYQPHDDDKPRMILWGKMVQAMAADAASIMNNPSATTGRRVVELERNLEQLQAQKKRLEETLGGTAEEKAGDVANRASMGVGLATQLLTALGGTFSSSPSPEAIEATLRTPGLHELSQAYRELGRGSLESIRELMRVQAEIRTVGVALSQAQNSVTASSIRAEYLRVLSRLWELATA